MIKNAADKPKLRAETLKARFLEAGVVEYKDERVIIKPENLMTIALKFKGAKIVVGHKTVNESNIDEIVGFVGNVWLEVDGWAWCDFTTNDQEAIDLINKGYSVSCAYIPVATGSGGTKNNVSYSREIIDIVEDDEETHIAIVESPRYEDAIILKNSIKNKVMNIFKLTKKDKKENSVKEIELESAAFEIDGKQIPVSDLMEVYKNAKDEEEKENEAKDEPKVNADDEFEVDGKMVKVSEMVKTFKAAKKNEEDEAKKNADDEEKAKEEKEKENAEDEKEKDEEKKEAKKNSVDAEKIIEAKAKYENGNSSEPKSGYVSESERFALGALAYGSPQKVTN